MKANRVTPQVVLVVVLAAADATDASADEARDATPSDVVEPEAVLPAGDEEVALLVPAEFAEDEEAMTPDPVDGVTLDAPFDVEEVEAPFAADEVGAPFEDAEAEAPFEDAAAEAPFEDAAAEAPFEDAAAEAPVEDAEAEAPAPTTGLELAGPAVVGEAVAPLERVLLRTAETSALMLEISAEFVTVLTGTNVELTRDTLEMTDAAGAGLLDAGETGALGLDTKDRVGAEEGLVVVVETAPLLVAVLR